MLEIVIASSDVSVETGGYVGENAMVVVGASIAVGVASLVGVLVTILGGETVACIISMVGLGVDLLEQDKSPFNINTKPNALMIFICI